MSLYTQRISMRILLSCLASAGLLCAQSGPSDFLNHNRPVPDAHNCYPYDGKWTDRIDRALTTGFQIAKSFQLSMVAQGLST